MNPKDLKKFIYSILKELTEGTCMPTASTYEITNDQFVEIIQLMLDEEYLNPKKVRINILGNAEIEKTIDTVTMKGFEFLEENSKWSKLYKGIKEFKEFITI